MPTPEELDAATLALRKATYRVRAEKLAADALADGLAITIVYVWDLYALQMKKSVMIDIQEIPK